MARPKIVVKKAKAKTPKTKAKTPKTKVDLPAVGTAAHKALVLQGVIKE